MLSELWGIMTHFWGACWPGVWYLSSPGLCHSIHTTALYYWIRLSAICAAHEDCLKKGATETSYRSFSSLYKVRFCQFTHKFLNH